jgi:flavin reductase (DIM6/NTAB) family NADH-FMN oxidoreductase RutF/rubredoxin
MDTNALFKIGYGLYILTANEGGKDNGCIINTVMQVTSEPCQIAVALNKQNYTSGMVSKTRKFNLSIMTEKSQFDEFKRFGYQSGKTVDKFSDFNETKRSPNGVLYITKNTNAYLSAYVKQEIDLDSHLLFIAQLVEAEVLNDEQTVSYEFYQKNIKPAPQKTSLKGWRCKICGFIYENEVLPPDYICPVCKHGAADFEKV